MIQPLKDDAKARDFDIVFFEGEDCTGRSMAIRGYRWDDEYKFSPKSVQHPKSYKATKYVELTFMGSNPEDSLRLESHEQLGKEACNPVNTSFDPVGAHIVKTQDLSDPSQLYKTQVLKCKDERYCVHLFSEKDFQGTELIFEANPEGRLESVNMHQFPPGIASWKSGANVWF